jgi:putative nucleotidyltransferase with HDIG domain
MTFKIMLASAGQDSRRQLERLLRRDYQVLGAGSGAEALGLLEQHDVALLVADESMDGMTGIELVRHAAALRPHMVRIILAGDRGMNEVFDATSSGEVYCYVMKPWDDEDLRLTVMRALEHYAVNRAQHEAEAEPVKGAGTLFDPEVVRAFCGLEALAKIRGRIVRGDFGSSFLAVKPPAELRRMPLEDLIREVESEPALCAAVLRAANAGQLEEHRTASLYAACARLGRNALRDIIAAAEVCERMDYEAEALRDHSRRCATAAMLLAEKTGTLDPDEAYTAGLLHDLGEALLRSLFPEEAKKIIRLGHPSRIEKEVAAFGVDHTQVGQWILDACHVPAALSFTVQTHHDLDHVNDPSALLLHVADAIACAHDSGEVAGLDSFTPDRLALLRLSRADLARVHELTTEMVGERFDSVAA